MHYLADTHSFLWYITGDGSLSASARQVMDEKAHPVYVSMASLWELAIKTTLGKLVLAKPFEELIPEQLERNEFTVLPISVGHLARLTQLPFHHRDPFDRLLIAQAQTEGLSIITRDPLFEAYEVDVVW